MKKDDSAPATVAFASGQTRWWENYLVRYLVPAAVGTLCVRWLDIQSGHRLGSVLLLGDSVNGELTSQKLILWLLGGMLFCYLASLPVLVMHATRVLDFNGASALVSGKWSAASYGASLLLAVLGCLLAYICPNKLLACVLTVVFSGVQVLRIARASRNICTSSAGGLTGTLAYRFYFRLGERRGGARKNSTSERSPSPATRVELIESYRHLREHGNAAYIVFLELTLAALLYCVVEGSQTGTNNVMAWTAGLIAIWILPAIGVHWMGQQMERRFARFDESKYQANSTKAEISDSVE